MHLNNRETQPTNMIGPIAAAAVAGRLQAGIIKS